MTEKKKLFRRVFDALIEGRTQQAQRYIDRYVKERTPDRPSKD